MGYLGTEHCEQEAAARPGDGPAPEGFDAQEGVGPYDQARTVLNRRCETGVSESSAVTSGEMRCVRLWKR